MPGSSKKSLSFPLGGVSLKGPYRQQTRPFSSPWAMNVRTDGPTEDRKRGGSRPGLTKLSTTDLGDGVQSLIPVTYIDSSGNRQYDLVYVANGGTLGLIRAGVATPTTAQLQGPDGVDIVTDDGATTIDYDGSVSSGSLQGVVRAGKVYLADSTLRSYDPATGVVATVVATAGIVPVAEPVIALYRDRIFLAGVTQAWHCSRAGDPTDWDWGADQADPGAAVTGQLAGAGRMGDVVTAMVPVDDQALVLASENSLWVLRGDPRTGQLQNVSESVGIIDEHAWAMSPDGLLVFLSNDGVYTWSAGSGGAPTRFSAERMPLELREVDPSAYTISMAYDQEDRGFHLFLTPADPAVGTHWWIDVENRAMWPQRLVGDQQPLASALLLEGGLGDVVLGCRDGYVRKFGGDTDDGHELESHVLIGPFRLAADDHRDAFFAEITGVIEDVSCDGVVEWRVVMGASAAEAAELAIIDLKEVLDGGVAVSVEASGEWSEGRNSVSRPRSRGAWAVVWLSSTESWAYEVVAVVGRQLGRHR